MLTKRFYDVLFMEKESRPVNLNDIGIVKPSVLQNVVATRNRLEYFTENFTGHGELFLSSN